MHYCRMHQHHYELLSRPEYHHRDNVLPPGLEKLIEATPADCIVEASLSPCQSSLILQDDIEASRLAPKLYFLETLVGASCVTLDYSVVRDGKSDWQ
jgi:hypothetical protein